ncbi:hypothetical protein CDAR_610241 [Caerostris darwini]|uniref:Uncharacterized protein n=1 Tax=Caerostris darwini TaxID=1538125 RepID=A0AAV4N663_9ARAC|nr:hypothetical protein CDAR_610241 [Caerostris darwini]
MIKKTNGTCPKMFSSLQKKITHQTEIKAKHSFQNNNARNWTNADTKKEQNYFDCADLWTRIDFTGGRGGRDETKVQSDDLRKTSRFEEIEVNCSGWRSINHSRSSRWIVVLSLDLQLQVRGQDFFALTPTTDVADPSRFGGKAKTMTPRKQWLLHGQTVNLVTKSLGPAITQAIREGK